MPKAVYAALITGLGVSPAIAMALIHHLIQAPLVIYNPSPSEPPGLYRLSDAAPGPGRLIAFPLPAPGMGYAAHHLRYLIHTSVLKEVAAVSGSTVCIHDGAIFIDGAKRGSVALRDRGGQQLPRWSGCRRLGPGELFAFSNRIPNSFDSRYYGPVQAHNVVGVYLPLWTE